MFKKILGSSKTSAILPIAAGIIAFIFMRLFVKENIYIYNIEFLLNAIINCTATFSGFVLTAISILVGLKASSIMNAIENNNNVHELLLIGAESLVLGLALISYCVIVGGTLNELSKNECIMCSTESALGLGITVAYFLSLLFICGFVFKIISLSSKDQCSSTKKSGSPDGNYRIDN